jgi:hypothetical protein
VDGRVVGEKLIRPLVGSPKNVIGPHVDAVDVNRRARTEVPLVQKFAVLAKHLETAIGAVVDVNPSCRRIGRDSMHMVEIARAPFVGWITFQSPTRERSSAL